MDSLKNMERNVGFFDSLGRVGLGILLVSMAAFYGDNKGDWVGWIGLVPLITGIVGVCPLYRLIGVNTCGMGTGKK